MDEVIVQGLRTGNQIHFAGDKWPLPFMPTKDDAVSVYGPTTRVTGTVQTTRFYIGAEEEPIRTKVTIFVQD